MYAGKRAPKTHCTHKWAHNDDPDKSGKNGNMRFAGMQLYSYATVVAVKYPKQKTVVFAGDGIYNSPTTTGHKSHARSALRNLGYTIVEADCDRYGYDLRSIRGIRECHDKMKKTLAAKLEKFAASRKGMSQALLLDEYNRYREKCNKVARFLKRGEIGEPDLGDGVLEQIRAGVAKREAAAEALRQRHEKAREEARRKRLDEEKDNAGLWREHRWTGDTWGWEGTYLRLSNGGKFVQTSKGVVVPFEDALALFRVCQRVRRGESDEVLTAGVKVDQWSVGEIDAEGNARIGCHRLSFSEMELCFGTAKAQGLVRE